MFCKAVQGTPPSCPAIAVRRTASLRSPMVPGIHVLFRDAKWKKDVDGRDKPGHDVPEPVPVDLIADPAFMAVSVIGVCLLGVSKGGFLGLGVIALPLMSLFVPPLQAAAIILPTALAQDALTLWAY